MQEHIAGAQNTHQRKHMSRREGVSRLLHLRGARVGIVTFGKLCLIGGVTTSSDLLNISYIILLYYYIILLVIITDSADRLIRSFHGRVL
jgi:hypothetical protein